MSSPVFHEVQYFRHPVVIGIVAFIALLSWYALVQQVVLGVPFGSSTAPDLGVWLIWALFGIVLPAWLLLLRLETVVKDGALRYRFFPLHPGWKEVPLKEVAGAVAVNYRPFREYGGWGIRFGRQGIAYTVSGDRGVLVRLRNGKAFLIGSNRAESLEIMLGRRERDERATKTELRFKEI
ncbi:MAG: DUF6141 family protein [Methanomicrobiaceae archaeon]|nr:DUF6141 family protein [Methanomicrobiaceae archaeon]